MMLLPSSKRRKYPLTLHRCECGRAVRLRKRDNVWQHLKSPWEAGRFGYQQFLKETSHPVKVVAVEHFFEGKGWLRIRG